MDNLKIVYKILVGIEASMDSPVFDGTFLEALKISEERRNRILQSMIDNMNAKSFFYKKGVTDIDAVYVDSDIELTQFF